MTVETLSVSQVFPAPDTAGVDLNSTITVIFNHPVVPLNIVEEQDKLPQPLKFTPTIKGKGEWVNSSVYVFQPEEILLSGTSYQVKVDAGIEDTLGNPLGESYIWAFDTRKPTIYNFALKGGEQNPSNGVTDMPLDQSFVVTFEQPMDVKSTEAAIKLINSETKAAFPVNFTWSDDNVTLLIEPKTNFSIASFYELTIADSAQAEDGGTLNAGMSVMLATVPLPAVSSVFPGADSDNADFHSSITIWFASQMDIDSLKGRVRITPAVPGMEDNWYYNSYDRSLNIYGLDPATHYVVRILPGMADLYGNTIKDEISYSFYNGDYSPYARIVLPWNPLVYRAKGDQEVYFEHLNITEATLSVYPITLAEFGRLTSGNVDMTAFSPSSQPVRKWNITGAERNNLESKLFDFKDKNGNPLEAGYYFIGMEGKPFKYSSRFYQASMFIVATDNITFKATPTEGLAWVTDLENGEPQNNAAVTFYNAEFQKLGTTNTDENGIAYLDNIKAANYAQVESGNHFGFTALYWGSGVSAGDFGLYQNYYSGEENLFAYLYTDRPVYRPDQEVFFKGILRQNDDLHYSLPRINQVYVVAEQWGEKIYEGYVPINDLGSFSGKVKLDADVSLGYYNIYVYRSKSPDEGPITAIGFSIAEYKKPEFEVLAAPNVNAILAGGEVNFGLDAEYYSGGVLKNAPVDWFIEATNYYFQPSSKYNRYSFMDWSRDMYWSPSETVDRSTTAEGSGVTNENGHLDISQSFEASKNNISQRMTLYANISDVAGNTVSGSTSVVVHQSELYAGIRSEKYVGVQGEAQPFSLVVLDWDSQPVANQKVTVSFVERRWFSVQKQDEQGQLQWETTVKEIPASSQEAVTGEDGIAQVDFIPPTGGVFKALVTVQDSKGNKHQASTYLWVTSNNQISWRQTNDRAFNLIADKDSYSPGETAEILIAQPFTGDVYALITYERGHIYKSEVVQLNGNGTIYKLPITDEMAPASYVSVTVISGAERGGAPDFKMGIARINVDTTLKTLDVSVSADKEAAGPGDEITYTIETKDTNGKPVSADVSLAVVDKAVLALAPSNSLPLLDSFYSQQGLSVITAVGIVSSADDFNALYRKTIPDGNKSGGGGGGEPGVITVRENFKDTAAFEAEVTTDEKGIATVEVELPENLTTWVAEVRAVTEDSRVGQATSELVSTKPLFVQLQTPRFFVVEDQLTVGATVFNNSEKSLKVEVSLDAEGVQVLSDPKQSIEIEGRQQAYVTWEIVVKANVERVDMTATAISGPFTDASKPALGTLDGQGIPVYNFTVVETVGTSGMILTADSVTESIQLPSTLNFDDASLSIEVSPSLAASMQSSLKYLEDYPYLCMEQTISRFLPNVITMRALDAAGQPTPMRSSLNTQVNSALQRIYAKQKYDGGWNWWDGELSDPQTSAYVVYGLIEAQASGYEISETVLANGLEYLKNNLPDIKRNDASWQYNRYAFMLYVLARADELDAGRTNFIFENHAKLDLYGEAYLAQAMFLLDEEDPRIKTLLSDLATATVQSASGAHWEESTKDHWNWNTDTRTTAIVLNAFVQIDPQNPITANAVRWLMAHRESGHWQSTQETAWSLIALTNWLIESKEYETDYKYAIGLNGNLLEEGQASAENLTETVNLQVQIEDLLKEQGNDLVITRGRGTGNLYYSAYLSTSLPVDSIQPLDQGVSLSREYFTLDDPKTPITEIERGELVKARLTIVIPAAVHYIVIDDPLPAGMEALDASLATDTAVPSFYSAQDYKDRGWGWWYFTHIELRDEKITLSADYLPAGTYVYTYIVRASTAGTFNVIPPTASEFYFPDVGGR
ncbi:Ig-like domain-containing protein, partial [Candidatus Villigracilis affinis]|uniref:Ig-like domain-containing protein n=1 Tax=Candidatus Villigracilis affinis TaxID=3140682 RepID=UPI001D52EDAE|nr:Ig-like domain-containing protein [Anaerolineales bacterium]